MELKREVGASSPGLDPAPSVVPASPALVRAVTLQAVTAALSRAATPTDVTNAVLEAGATALGADAGMFTLLGRDGATFETVHAVGLPPAFVESVRSLPPDARHPMTQAVRTGEIVAYADAAERVTRFGGSPPAELQAALMVPLTVGDRLIGVWSIGFRASRTLGDEELAFLRDLGQEAAQALERASLYERERSARERAERLQRITVAFTRAASPEDVTEVVTTELPLISGARAAGLMLLSHDGAEFVVAGTSGYADEVLAPWLRFPNAPHLPAGAAVRTGQPVWIRSAAEWRTRWGASFLEGMGDEACACLPLSTGDAMLGVVSIVFGASRDFSPEDRAWYEALGSLCSQALDRARLLAAEERARTRMERLQQFTLALSGAVTPQQVADVTLHAAMTALGADGGGVVLCVSATEAALVAEAGFTEQDSSAWLRFPLDAPYPVNDAIGGRRLVFMRDIDEWHARYPALAQAIAANGHQAYAAAPLEVDGRVLGAINYNFRERRTFTGDDRALMEAIARQAAQAFERARLYDEARAANRAKTDFLAKMSHELRTPLNAIGGYTELIAIGVHGPVTEAQATALERVQRSQRHLLGLINDILDFSKVEVGAMRLESERVDLRDIVATMEELIGLEFGTRGVAYEVIVCPDPVIVLGDRERLVQVCVNLVSNALKATAPGGHVRVACALADRRASIAVADTGRGIPADQLEAIFSPFTQLGRTLSRPGGGVGLGLAISRELARAMGGELTVMSREGEGSTFTLGMPLA